MARSSRNKSSTSITQGEINGAVTMGSRGNDGLGFKDSNINMFREDSPLFL